MNLGLVYLFTTPVVWIDFSVMAYCASDVFVCLKMCIVWMENQFWQIVSFFKQEIKLSGV